MINTSDLPEKVKDNYDKWVAITGINSLDAYFENAVLECINNKGRKYEKFHIDGNEVFIEDSTSYKWLFYYGVFGSVFERFINQVNTLYENRNQ